MHEVTATDKELQILKSHIMDGFLMSANKCPEMIRSYFPYRDELTVQWFGAKRESHCNISNFEK